MNMAERHSRILGELSEFGLDLARKLHGQAMAAETPQETADLARAFHSVSRSVRQTLALEAKLARDARRQDGEDRAAAERLERNERYEADRIARAPFEERKSRIGHALQRVIYSEYEDEDEAEALFETVDERLGEDAECAGFLEDAIDDQIERLCKDFGLTPPERPLERPAARDPEAPPLGDWADPPQSPDPGTGNGALPP